MLFPNVHSENPQTQSHNDPTFTMHPLSPPIHSQNPYIPLHIPIWARLKGPETLTPKPRCIGVISLLPKFQARELRGYLGLGFRVQDVCMYIYIYREFRVTCKVYTGVHEDVEGVGFRDITPIMENQMKKNMKITWKL